MLKQILLLMTFTMPMFSLSIFAAQASDIDENGPKRLIMSVGIGTFEDTFWSSLDYSEKDAKDMHQFLRHEAVPSFDWTALLTPDSLDQKRVTKNLFFSTFDRLSDANRSQQDIVVIYISTHGTVDINENGKPVRYLVTQDTRSDDIAGTAINYQELLQKFRSLQSKKKALILDSCHSGVGKSVITNAMIEEIGRRKGTLFPDLVDEVAEGEYILAASKWNESAQESNIYKNGIYTHFLLEGFTKDENRDGAVTLREAHSYARAMTYKVTNGNQTPNEKSIIQDTDPIFITGRKKEGFEDSYIFNYLEKLSELNVYVNGIFKGKLKGGVSVPAGRVRIKLVDPKTSQASLDQVYTIKKGTEDSFSNLLFPKTYNHLEVGYKFSQYASKKYSKAFAPSTLAATEIRYSREAFWGVYDLHLALALHSIEGNSESVPTSEAIETETDRREIEAYAGLGQSNPWRFLPVSPKLFKTSIYWHGGLVANHVTLDRIISGEQFSGTAVGGRGNLGLMAQIPLFRLKFGLEGQLSLLSSPFENTESLLVRNGIIAYVGANW